MLHANARNFFDRLCCSCVLDDTSMHDDGQFNCCLPRRVGGSILFYGKRKSYFPFHCMVGPDWVVVALVIALIVALNVVVLYVVSPLGWPPVLIGGFGAAVLLGAYFCVVFTDPGTVYENDYSSLIPNESSEVEDPLHQTATNSPARASIGMEEHKQTPVFVNSIQTMECGQCQFRRPTSARHCIYCRTCIDHLDHHCPWCGKCIGEKNLKAFYIFVNLIFFQFYYLLGTFVYYLLFAFSGTYVPSGPHFRS